MNIRTLRNEGYLEVFGIRWRRVRKVSFSEWSNLFGRGLKALSLVETCFFLSVRRCFCLSSGRHISLVPKVVLFGTFDGRELIDMSIMGIGTNLLGYGHPEVDAAVADIVPPAI